ncbi:MAG: trehalose-6-phosphate synthase [Bdellovibrionia bacterium]
MQQLIVIANREPYVHQRDGASVKVVRPASGLVTALEPVLRQFGGLWVAHGSGSADFETVDANSEVGVPPTNPTYRLRRVKLSTDEENGYYYGFANEGLWPLCHLAHNRPVFRTSDWEHYRSVNQRFARTVQEQDLNDDSLILVQDYHFALVPRFLREQYENRKFKISLFWHIPWPNPEAFGICPWGKEVLRGMLGADVIGFHTQYHCNNFLETCNRYLEARIDWERFSVTMENHETLVRAFPIGIDPKPVKVLNFLEIIQLKKDYKIDAEIIAVGVDRLDYTKGLIERIEATERFLEKYPKYQGKFTLAQMCAPSRTMIPAYKILAEKLKAVITRVNSRFSKLGDSYQPIVFLHQHFEWEDIQYFYQLGKLCLVTSLHDGMNLVAKEYVWCQQPEAGSLVLSKFTGASRELSEAFIVNPYSIEEMADAIAGAIQLPDADRIRRMQAMKEKIFTQSAFQWAEDLIRVLQNKIDNPLNDFPSPQDTCKVAAWQRREPAPLPSQLRTLSGQSRKTS